MPLPNAMFSEVPLSNVMPLYDTILLEISLSGAMLAEDCNIANYAGATRKIECLSLNK